MQKRVYTEWIHEVFKQYSSKLKEDLFKEFCTGSKLLLLLEKLLRKPSEAAFERTVSAENVKRALDFLKVPESLISPKEIMAGDEAKTLKLVWIIIAKVSL